MKRLSFAHAPSPLLIGVIRRKTVDDAIADIRQCEKDGATAIDLHLSCLEPAAQTADALRQIINAATTPVLALNYNQTYDWQGFETTEEERVELLLRAMEAGASAIDLQGYTYDIASKHAYTGDTGEYSFTKNAPREVVTDPAVIARQTELIKRIHASGAEVLISTHTGVALTAEQALDLARFLEQRNPDIIKIVAACNTEEELAEAFRTILILNKEVKTVVHYHVSGKLGRITRILNPLLGGHMIFCSDAQHPGANAEQLDLKNAVTAVESIKKLMQ